MEKVEALAIIMKLLSIYELIQLNKGQLQRQHKYRHAIQTKSRNEQRHDQTRQGTNWNITLRSTCCSGKEVVYYIFLVCVCVCVRACVCVCVCVALSIQHAMPMCHIVACSTLPYIFPHLINVTIFPPKLPKTCVSSFPLPGLSEILLIVRRTE
jgi:hypothetical protein